MQKLLKRLGVQSNLTSGYHPQANGQTERANQEVEKYLRLYVGRRQNDWAKHLPMAEFVINSRIHSAHDLSPFEAIYGYQPLFNIPVGQRAGRADVDDRVEMLKEVRKETEAALEQVKREQKAAYEKGKREAHEFQVGDFVWLDAGDIKLKTPSRKLSDRQLGPFEIVERIGDLDYRLQLPWGRHRIHPVFHVDKLYPHRGNDINGERPEEPGPIELEEDGAVGEYEVEKVLDSRIFRRKLQYEVKWEGWDEGHITWEPEENLKNAREAIDDFHKDNPDAVGPADVPPPKVRKKRKRKARR